MSRIMTTAERRERREAEIIGAKRAGATPYEAQRRDERMTAAEERAQAMVLACDPFGDHFRIIGRRLPRERHYLTGGDE